VQKLSPTGDVVWSRQFGSKTIDIANAVAISADGSVHLAGYTKGVLPGQSSSGDGDDGFVVKLDAQGTILWTDEFVLDGVAHADGVAVDSKGTVVVTGYTVPAHPEVDPKNGARDRRGDLRRAGSER
jgi:hypothetical protein